MNRRPKALKDALVGRPTDNQSRVECAMMVLQDMAIEAARRRHSGTIGVEIPIKDGKLGKVKQLQVVFHPE